MIFVERKQSHTGQHLEATDTAAVLAQKRLLRDAVGRRLATSAGLEERSRAICQRLMALPGYQNSKVICTYVALPMEVQTLDLIRRAWDDRKEVAVPCCMGDRLRLFHLKSMKELVPRTLGILEPRAEHWQRKERWLEPSRIDLFVVPGVAFDRLGGRLGHGRGYYDRLLVDADPQALRVALAFENQLVDAVPMTSHDVFMQHVITEEAVRGAGRS